MNDTTVEGILATLDIQENNIRTETAAVARYTEELENLERNLKTARENLQEYTWRNNWLQALTVPAILYEIVLTTNEELIGGHLSLLRFLQEAFGIHMETAGETGFRKFCGAAKACLEEKEWHAEAKAKFRLTVQPDGKTLEMQDGTGSMSIPKGVLEDLKTFWEDIEEYERAMMKRPGTQEEYLQYYKLKKSYE